MSKVTKYKQSNGRYSVLVEGVDLTDDALLLLDNGYPLDVNIEIQDGKKITVKQRKKIFALLNDIYLFTGQPQEDLRQQFQFYLEMIKGYERISLTNTTRHIASELIDTIIAWVFQNDIPLNYKTSDLMKQDQTFLYLATVHRKCVICGRRGELAHHKAIGRGANRKKMDHYGYEVLALCREHHQSQHNMGVETFDKLHHLENSWVPVNNRLNDMLKGRS